MKSIVMLAFQFGKLPNYFQLWLNTAKNNSTIDFIIFTDDETQYNVPTNVRMVKMSFQEMKEKIQQCFDFEVLIDRPYKVCDYRPGFGYIFQSDISGYDFWGTVDLDVILGDIRSFITDDILTKYNRILTRDHFTLYRNETEINKRFMFPMKKVDEPYKKVFTDSSIYAFGERAPISVWNIWIDNGWYNEEYDKPIDGNIDYNVYRLRTFYDSKGKGSVFAYEAGKLWEISSNDIGVLVKKEWLYIHLGRRNMKTNLDQSAEKFVVIPSAFEVKDQIDLSFVKKYSGFRMFFPDKLRLINRAYIKLQRKIKQMRVK